MSQPEHRTLSIADHKAESFQDSPPLNGTQMVQNQELDPKVSDGSGPLFTMYCTTEKNYKNAEHLQDNSEKLILFMGLFSATVATILSVTWQDLRPDPQGRSAFYLENLYQLQVLGDSNMSRPSAPAQPPPFSPPRYAIWVNGLLSISLCLNVGAAILAISLWRWISFSLLVAKSSRYSPYYRARVQHAVANEYHDSRMPVSWFVTMMVYASGGCCFLGVAIYHFNINRTVFSLFFPCWVFCAIAFWSFESFFGRLHFSKSPMWDDRVLDKLFKTLVKDSDWMKFFESIPGFCRSSVVQDPVRRIKKLGEENLHTAVKKFLERTWSSNLLFDSEKMRRLVVCVNFADSVRLPSVALSILQDIFPRDRHNALQSVEMGHLLRSQGDSKQKEIGLCGQSIVAGIISNVEERDDRWVALAADQLGKSEDVIRGYLERGNDDVLLVNLTHITRQIFHSSKDNRDMAVASSSILPSLCEFEVRTTLPELQLDFLALWREIGEAPNDNVPTVIRDSLFSVYNILTQRTVDASTPITPPNPSDSNSPPEAPISYQDASLITSSPQPLLPTPGHIPIALANESLLGSIPERTHCPTAASASSSLIPSPLRSQGHSGISQAITSAATTKSGDIAVPFTTREVASPRGTSTASVIAHHDAQLEYMNDPVEMSSLPRTRQLDLSVPDTSA